MIRTVSQALILAACGAACVDLAKPAGPLPGDGAGGQGGIDSGGGAGGGNSDGTEGPPAEPGAEKPKDGPVDPADAAVDAPAEADLDGPPADGPGGGGGGGSDTTEGPPAEPGVDKPKDGPVDPADAVVDAPAEADLDGSPVDGSGGTGGTGKICTRAGTTPPGGCKTGADCPLPAPTGGFGWCLGSTKQGKACDGQTQCNASPVGACTTARQCPAQLCRRTATPCMSDEQCGFVKVCSNSSAGFPAAASFPALGDPHHPCVEDAQCAALDTPAGYVYCRPMVAVDTGGDCIGYGGDATYEGNTCSTTCTQTTISNQERCIWDVNRCVTAPTTCASDCLGTCHGGSLPCQGDANCDYTCSADADCPSHRCQYDASTSCTDDTDCSGLRYCAGSSNNKLPTVDGRPVMQRCALDGDCNPTTMAGLSYPAGNAGWWCTTIDDLGIANPSITPYCLTASNLCVNGRCLDEFTAACVRPLP